MQIYSETYMQEPASAFNSGEPAAETQLLPGDTETSVQSLRLWLRLYIKLGKIKNIT